MKSNKLPKFLYEYFWDTKAEKVNPQQSWQVVIEKILEYGDQKSINWLFSYYSKPKIKQVIKKTRNLSPKSANFWANYFNIINREQITCLKSSYLKKRRSVWPY